MITSPLRSRLGLDSADTRESCLRGRNLGPSLKETERGCRVRESPALSSSEDRSPTVSTGATICTRDHKQLANCSVKSLL